MSRKSLPCDITTIGIDIGKNSFHLISLDRRGVITLAEALIFVLPTWFGSIARYQQRSPDTNKNTNNFHRWEYRPPLHSRSNATTSAQIAFKRRGTSAIAQESNRRYRKILQYQLDGAQGRNRTSDTRIFSPLLYQLSYLGLPAGVRRKPRLIEKIPKPVQPRRSADNRLIRLCFFGFHGPLGGVAGNPIAFVEPTGKIDVGATCRAERPVASG
jgi:hypothetical protein